MKNHHLYCALTREEFQVVWAIRMTQAFENFDDAYPLDAYPSPGSPEIANTYEEQVRRAIRFLAMEHDFAFQGLEVGDDGTIQGRMIEPRNAVYVRAIALYAATNGAGGAMPHPIRAAETAIRVLGERCPRLSLDPLHQLLRELDSAVDQAPDPEPEQVAAVEKMKNRALAAVGVSREVH